MSATNSLSQSQFGRNMGKMSINFGMYGEKGVRKQMEDEHLICLSLKQQNPSLPETFDFAIFAIMDGHGGRQTASFVRDHLAGEIASQLILLEPDVAAAELSDSTVKQVINGAFSKIDSRIATEIPSCKDGSTIVLSLVAGNVVYVASLGDSAAYLGLDRSGILHAVPLTEAHKPWVIKEKDRILKFGGSIENGRVNASLEVTRSFGDISLKKYGILSHPTFRKFEVDLTEALFVVMGCDGFWSCWTAFDVVQKASSLINQEVKRRALEGVREPLDVRSICKKLVEYVIIDKKSQDNVSVLIICFAKSSE